MPDNVEPHPPIRRITHIRRRLPLEWSLLSAILAGGALGLCGVIGFSVLFGSGRQSQSPATRPTAIVVTVTPTPIVPTPTLSPEPPAPPTPEGLYIGGYALVSGTGGDGLRLRADPGLQTTTLKTAPDGTRLLILDGPREVDSFTWWRLRDPSDGAEGWGAQLYLAPTGAP
ncbi:MAG TPA: SH3 domain-containing protein [Anaerolineae bacterium]|nr:SH3 domain-containing protein [Anaerolineae bacterium]